MPIPHYTSNYIINILFFFNLGKEVVPDSGSGNKTHLIFEVNFPKDYIALVNWHLQDARTSKVH